ncbi:MAG TPA: TIGR03936 family radical SAM-associated protein [Mycobacteriales bacterium]|nr:TIGR03936 family radical SAM-associated protein [Mycobacteriales bacterium]
MARQPDGPPPPPVVQRLRIRYAKRGRLRFTSHRDFARAFERALRRAAVPMAYSAGFSPHPKISYVGAAPTGVASEAEYLEVGLAQRRDPAELRRQLDGALPPGLDVLDVVEADGASLAERIEASLWRAELLGVSAGAAAAAAERFLALAEAPVERVTKDGKRVVDARAAVVALAAAPAADPHRWPGVGDGAPASGTPAASSDCAILDLVVRHTTPAVRPDDVLTALRQAAALSTPVAPRVTRLAQGRLDETPSVTAAPTGPPGLHVRLTDPLVTDTVAAAPL